MFLDCEEHVLERTIVRGRRRWVGDRTLPERHPVRMRGTLRRFSLQRCSLSVGTDGSDRFLPHLVDLTVGRQQVFTLLLMHCRNHIAVRNAIYL